MEMVITILGWIGTALIILAYYLVSTRKIDANGKKYQILNLIGAIFIGVYVFYQQAWPALALEVLWAAIAIAALIKNK